MIPAIDVHAHSVPRGWPQLTDPEPRLWLSVTGEAEATMMIGSREFRRTISSAWAADVRLADMAADGVEMQVVSPTPVFFACDSTPAYAAAIARIFNDLACAELERSEDERNLLLRGDVTTWLGLDQLVAAS